MAFGRLGRERRFGQLLRLSLLPLGLLILGAVIVAIVVTNRPSPSAPAYRYPDLPLQWEEIIATESDCGRLREINVEIIDWQFAGDVKLDAWASVEHRAALIGCNL